MNIQIYQVNLNRDENNVAFMSYEQLPRFQGSQEVDSSLYDKVFSGEVECNNLEDVYVMFNQNHPNGYKARSLSKSDVVEIIGNDGASEFHYCDSVGFKKVDFEAEKATLSDSFFDLSQREKTLSVLLVEPERYPKMIEIEDTLEAMQHLVGGDIEEYMPFEDEVAIICNDEGKANGLPINRAVYVDEDKSKIADIICGKFFLVYAPIESENFLSLPPELSEKYREKFKYSERFARVNNEIVAIPFKPKAKEMER